MTTKKTRRSAGDDAVGYRTRLRRTPKQNRANEIVEKILNSTASLVGRLGIAKVSTSAIAQDLGIPVGTVYRYFSNKEEIFAALAEWFHVRKDSRLSNLKIEADSFSNLDDFLRHLVSSVLDHLRQEVGYIDLLRVSTHLPDHYEQNLRSADRWANAMCRLNRFSGLKIPEARRMTFFRLAMLISITAQERVLLCEDPEEAQHLEEEYKTMLTSYFGHYV